MTLLKCVFQWNAVFSLTSVLVSADHWSAVPVNTNGNDQQIIALASELEQVQQNLKVIVTASINELKADIGQAQGKTQQCSTSSSDSTCQSTATKFQKYAKQLYNGCPSNYQRFQNSCYKVFTDIIDWWSAFRECDREGADLMSIQTPAENNFVEGLMSRYRMKLAWTAGNDQERENSFQWGTMTSTAINFYNWKQGQPNDYGNQDCIGISAPGMWEDYKCSDWMGFICEKNAE